MKNYMNYMVVIAALLVVFACDPYSDIYDELDAKEDEVPFDVKQFDYTLTDEDFGLLSSVDGGADIAKNKYFTSPEQAGQFTPHILKTKNPLLGNGSSILVTYRLYEPVRVDSAGGHKLTPEEYTAIAEPTNTLQNEADVLKAAAYVWPTAGDFDLLALTYDAPTKVDSVSKVAYYSGVWSLPYIVTPADYRFMGQPRFNNFTDLATPIDRIATLFNRNFPFAAAGDARLVLFRYSYTPTGGTRTEEDALVLLLFDGTKWVGQKDIMPKTLHFGHDGTGWAPDNTKPYKLVAADYKAIAENKGLQNSDAANANSFGNFDRRPSSSNYWDDTEIETGLDFLLQKLYPAAAEGQKYAVTFAVYTGAAGVETITMIKGKEKYIRFVKK
jgi:hypothetical protein